MGKLAEIVQQERLEAIKPAIIKGTPVEGEPMFKSDAFSGFSGFLSDEPKEEAQINPEQEKMMSIFTIMKMLMKMMD